MNAYKTLFKKCEGSSQFGKYRHTWELKVKKRGKTIPVIGCEGP
jgi:hypothetical protein